MSDVADARILDRAHKRDIETHVIGTSRFKTKLEPELEHDVVRRLQEKQVDLVVLAGYMRVLKQPLLQAFAGRIMNIHPSLLPAFPGLHAWEQAVEYGARLSGCTVHFVDDGVDTGPIIMQQPVPIFADDTPSTLHQRIQLAEHTLYPQAVRLFAEKKLRVNGRKVEILS